MLAYLAALAALEVSAGMVIAEAWRTQRLQAVVTSSQLAQLGQLLARLQVLEGVVAGGALVTMVLWSFLAVRNASMAVRGGLDAWLIVATWVGAPIIVIVLGRVHLGRGLAELSIAVPIAQAFVIYVPFGMMAWSSRQVGGRVAPFFRWYLSVALAFVVHEVFTGSLNLATPQPSDDLGRTAAMYLVNSLVVGLMVVMAKDATMSMQLATAERLDLHRSLRGDAASRQHHAVTPEHRAQFAHHQPVPVAVGASSAPATEMLPVTRES